MFWDASSAYSTLCSPLKLLLILTLLAVNNRFDAAMKSAVGGSTGGSTPPPPPPPSGSVTIHPNGDTSKCLDVQSANIANGTPVQMYAPFVFTLSSPLTLNLVTTATAPTRRSGLSTAARLPYKSRAPTSASTPPAAPRRTAPRSRSGSATPVLLRRRGTTPTTTASLS